MTSEQRAAAIIDGVKFLGGMAVFGAFCIAAACVLILISFAMHGG